MVSYTRRQWITLVIFSFAQFCSALCISIQAPFFPAESERKGAKPSEYGFVFGVYELVVFISSPIYGRYMNSLGVKLVNNTGIFTLSLTCILFGFLVKINGATTFIAFAFAIRILEATGTSAFVTSAFSIIAKEFPANVGSAFATLETFFGLGLILGPSIGGVFYELGGFMLPFTIVGCLLLFTTLLIMVILPSQNDNNISSNSSGNVFSLLIKPPILISSLIISGCSFSIGFVQATLEPHIRALNLTAIQLGLVFVVNGATYALSAPLWGRMCDIYFSPFSICCVGTILVVIAFFLMGPAPYLALHSSLSIVIIALVIHGLGMGAELVATFVAFHKDALVLGFPDNISTYALISGLWTSAFALGAFIGPSVAGVLFDNIGFPWASQTVVLLHGLLLITTVGYLCSSRKKIRIDSASTITTLSEEEGPLISRDLEFGRSYGSLTSRDLH